MELTQFFAQLVGIYLLVTGASVLMQPERAKRAINDVSKSSVLPYFDGALAVLFGLVIVLLHPIWDGMDAMLVSAVGWISFVGGAAEMLMSEAAVKKMYKVFGSAAWRTGLGVGAFLIGAYLTYTGFLG